MPASPDDRRVLVFAGVLVVIAGLFVAGVLFFAMGGSQDPPSKSKPLFLGIVGEKVKGIREEGPQYIANPFGDAGLWLDLEDGQVVVLSALKPGTTDCIMKWRDPRKAYVDSCTDRDFTSRDLDRFRTTIGSVQDGAPKDALYVDLRVREPAPGDTSGG